jgi:GAF domain-containing protein/anti-sigma regulatory factor (Ser/Thr protein kinase)
MERRENSRTGVIGAERAQRFLDEARVLLATSLEYEPTLAEIAHLAVPELADWCGVDVVEEDGSTRQTTSRHPDPEQEALLMELRRRYRAETAGQRGVLRVIRTGEPELVEDARGAPQIALAGDEERKVYGRLHPTSYMIIPLRARGSVLGALTLLSLRDDRLYGAADVAFALRLADLCALAADNARAHTHAQRSLAVLDATFAIAPVGLGLLDRDLRFVRVNDHLAVLNRRPRDEHLGRRPDFTGPWGAQRTELFRRVLETGEPLIDHEMPGISADTTWVVSGTPVPGPDGEPAAVLETVVDVTERKALLDAERAARRREGLLARAGEQLERSLDFDSTLERVAGVPVPEFCDWCAVFVADDNGSGLRLGALQHADPDRAAWAWRLQARFPPDPNATTGAPAVIRTGELEVVNGVTDEMLQLAAHDEEHLEILRGLGLYAAVTVPLTARGRTLGAISFASTQAGRRFEPADVELARDLGRRAGMAVDNARLYTARAQIAHTLQARLLPPRLPAIPGVELSARYRAAGEFNEVGGDFYDVMPTRGSDWIVAVGDVTGKGADAAAVTALARYTLRAAAYQEESPSGMLRMLNDAMLAQSEEGQFCTVCLARVRRRNGRLAVSLALGGHEPALVLRAAGPVEECGHHGSLIGLLEHPALEDADVDLAAGDVLVLYTDGVTDAGAPEHPIGPDGLVALLTGLRGEPPDRILDAIEQAAVHVQEGEPRDDIALVAVSPEEGMADADPGSTSTMDYTSVQVPGGPQAPSQARYALQQQLIGRVPDPLLDDAGLLVSELVTNSVLHGRVGPDETVDLRLGLNNERVRIEVSDFGPGFDPRATAGSPEDPGGYGLFLVTQLADAWGVGPGDSPTQVWFELRYAAKAAG